MAKKVIEFEREQFLNEVTDNWDKWKNGTKVKEFAEYMVQHAFTKKSIGTLESMTKDELRKIIINGDQETLPGASQSTSRDGFGNNLIGFLEEFKIELHKKALNPFVKKQSIKIIDKQIEKVEDDAVVEKFGYFGMAFVFLLFVLDMALPNGYKDTIKKFKEFRAKRKQKRDKNTIEAEVVK